MRLDSEWRRLRWIGPALGGTSLAFAAALLFAFVALPGVAAARGTARTDGAERLVASPVTAAQALPRAVTFAEAPGSSPNYIFPFVTLGHYSLANIEQFQYLMYRPLYWFGTAGSVTLNERKSLARLPIFSDHDRVVTVTLKPYRWSDGEKVDARDVLFWLNIWDQKPTAFAGWFPGGMSLPTILRGVRIKSPSTLEIELKHAINPTWFTYNQLSMITPLPLAWTRTSMGASPGSGGCTHARFGASDASCKAVYDFLSEQSGFDPTKPTTRINALPTYATSPLWSVVDGPWKLDSFGATQPAVFVPNPDYSGPDKPRISEFVEEPFNTTAAEVRALADDSVDVGYLPMTSVTAKTRTPGRAGPNNGALAGHYRIVPVYPWGINFATYNFDSTGDTRSAGAIFRQLYVRQAMQLLVDQPALIRRWADGYGVPTVGPVPLVPPSPFLSSLEEKNPYRYNPRRAAMLLRSHGWTVSPGGVDTCLRPGRDPHRCGTGVAAGAKLTLTAYVVSGTRRIRDLFKTEVETWARVGIRVTPDYSSFTEGFGPCRGTCSAPQRKPTRLAPISSRTLPSSRSLLGRSTSSSPTTR